MNKRKRQLLASNKVKIKYRVKNPDWSFTSGLSGVRSAMNVLTSFFTNWYQTTINAVRTEQEAKHDSRNQQ